MDPIEFTILGEPASKANSRELVTINHRPAIIKSQKARSYVRSALLQIPVEYRRRLEGPVEIQLRIYYSSERPDLDESVVLDILQDQWTRMGNGQRLLVQAGVYRNDRQVRRKVVEHGIDKRNPRVEVRIIPRQAQQVELVEVEVDMNGRC